MIFTQSYEFLHVDPQKLHGAFHIVQDDLNERHKSRVD